MTPEETKTMNQWGSHQAPLVAAIALSSGPVLELGVGHFSTPLLHALCGALGRMLVSMDADPQWQDWFKQRYSCTTHHFIQGESVWERIKGDRWGVAFIDHSESVEQRVKDFLTLLPISQFVIVHDCHGDNANALIPAAKEIGAVWYIADTYQPPTLVASTSLRLLEGHQFSLRLSVFPP